MVSISLESKIIKTCKSFFTRFFDKVFLKITDYPINQSRLNKEKQLLFELFVRLETQDTGSADIEEITRFVDEMTEIMSISPENMDKYR